MAEQVDERVEVNDELEQTVEESMKKKRGNEEAENIKQKASEWASDMAYFSWRDKL